ncbi:MAG: hypothetical protein FWH03_04525 [Firmicutes bacterium]|nr:hypothetical protein [Bacillota bacterium]
MKKLVVCLMLAVIALGVLAFAGCGYDESALLTRIEQLEQDGVDTLDELAKLKQDNAALAARLALAEGVLSSGPANTIYSIGDEVTISAHGYDLFKIRLDSTEGGGSFYVRLTVTNINMPDIRVAQYIGISYLRANNTFLNMGLDTNATVINKGQTGEFLFSVISSNLGGTGVNPKSIYLGFPNDNGAPFIPYAIFQIS